MLNLLHLSDLHFGPDHSWGKRPRPRLDEAIHLILKKSFTEPIHVVILSGDLTSEGNMNEYHLVKEFLEKLLQHESFGEIKDIIIVPGNHDYPYYDPSDKTKEITSQKEREKHFRNFINDLLPKLKSEFIKATIDDNSIIKQIFQGRLTEELMDISFIRCQNPHSHEHFSFLFFAMNSMKIDSKIDAGIGWFQENQLNLIEDIALFCQNTYNTFEIIPVAICHHHLVPISSVDKEYFESKDGKRIRRVSVTLDARSVLDVLDKIGCRLVFHGHKHHPACISWRNRIGSNKRTINIIAAGSAGIIKAETGDISLNHFFIHSVTKSSLNAKSFTASQDRNAIFEPDKRFSFNLIWPPSYADDEDCILANIEPINSLKPIIPGEADSSDLFFSFMNVINCKQTRRIIKELSEKNTGLIKVCALYDLYGRYDIVVKYRELIIGGGEKFHDELERYLKSNSNKQIREDTEPPLKNIKKEIYNLEGAEAPYSLILLRDDKAYIESLWTCAFIEILFRQRMTIGQFMNHFKTKLQGDNNRKFSSIIKGTYLTRDDSLIFELKMSCKQFHYLNELSRIIESIIDRKEIDKYTHIAYSHQEFSA